MLKKQVLTTAAAVSTLFSTIALATPAHDQREVAALDIEYQEAVKHGDAETIDRILHPEFAMVFGDGRVVGRDDVIGPAKSGAVKYEIQDEEPGTQTVRVYGDTAIVTALIWVKGEYNGKPFDRRVWFSDTYVRTPEGWRYAFAQVSLPLPE